MSSGSRNINKTKFTKSQRNRSIQLNIGKISHPNLLALLSKSLNVTHVMQGMANFDLKTFFVIQNWFCYDQDI